MEEEANQKAIYTWESLYFTIWNLNIIKQFF